MVGKVLSALVGAIIGLVLGSLANNFVPEVLMPEGGGAMSSFEFNGVRGYEATGQIGAIVGIVLGGGSGTLLGLRYGGVSAVASVIGALLGGALAFLACQSVLGSAYGLVGAASLTAIAIIAALAGIWFGAWLALRITTRSKTTSERVRDA